MTRAVIAIGSNQGNRACSVRFAFRELDRIPKTRLLARSKIRPSAPMGRHAGGEYLNAAAEIETGLSPMGLLVELKRLEARRGRRADGIWRPRPLDLDIVKFGNRSVAGPFLTLPHPGARSRPFVLAALGDL